MGTLAVRVRNAEREPIDDQVEVRVFSNAMGTMVGVARNVSGRRTVRFDDLAPGRSYRVQVFADRHRPVSHFVMLPLSKPHTVEICCPLHPDRVVASIPDYDGLPAALVDVLRESALEGSTTSGAELYGDLNEKQQAGLLNLFAKMISFKFDETRSVWSSVRRVYRVRPDRIFVEVEVDLRDRVKSALVTHRFKDRGGEGFRDANDKLHTPPPGFASGGSFKTTDPYGNLQLSFFSSLTAPLTFKVDADIDNAAGIGHAFQVLENWMTSGETDPYDIHQILAFRQDVPLFYQLA